MGNTKIEWATSVWNPVTGCDPNDGYQSESCINCYARRMSKRLKGRFGYPADDPFKVTFHLDKLDQPYRWKKPRRIFVCSMGDLFHKDVKDEWLNKIIGTLGDGLLSHHTFIILTKRPKRMAEQFKSLDMRWWSNTWLGVTAENQKRWDERKFFLNIPAAKHIVSLEPLLGDIKYLTSFRCPSCGHIYGFHESTKATRLQCPNDCGRVIPCNEIKNHIIMPDWVIAGCESGPKRRLSKLEWFASLRDQCVAAGVPFFLKQMDDFPGGKIIKMPYLGVQQWDQYPTHK